MSSSLIVAPSLIVDYTTPSLWDTLPRDMQRVIIGFKQTMEARDKYDKVVKSIIEATSHMCGSIDAVKDLALLYGYTKRFGRWTICVAAVINCGHQCNQKCKCNSYVLKRSEHDYYSKWVTFVM